MFQKKRLFFLFQFFFSPQQAVPLRGAPCQGLDGSVQVGEVGPGRKIRTGACHALIRSAFLSLPGPQRQSRRGPGDGHPAVTLSGSGKRLPPAGLQRARAKRGRPSQAAAARSAHVTSASTAEMERRPGDRGRMGGREAPRRPTRAYRRHRRLPLLPALGLPQPAAGLTCVADDDVLEEIGVRHGRGRSVPGSRLLLPLCASSAPSPAPLGREPGPRPPSVAVRASSKGRGAAGRTDSAERGSQRPSPSEQ